MGDGRGNVNEERRCSESAMNSVVIHLRDGWRNGQRRKRESEETHRELVVILICQVCGFVVSPTPEILRRDITA